MKNFKNSAILLVMTLTVSINALATGDNELSKSPVNVVSVSDGKYNLFYASDKIENVSVSILGESGKRLHTEFIKRGKGFKLPIDLSQLPEGAYQIKVNAENKVYQTTIDHKKDPSPYFNAKIEDLGDGNRYSVKVVREEKMPITVSFNDKFNNVIYSERIDMDCNFIKVYNLKRHAKDAKTISITSGVNSLNYVIN